MFMIQADILLESVLTGKLESKKNQNNSEIARVKFAKPLGQTFQWLTPLATEVSP